jgi:hypothetical protein
MTEEEIIRERLIVDEKALRKLLKKTATLRSAVLYGDPAIK